jgi:hypothetical protein
MRAAKVLAVLVVAALAIGSLSAVALAGNKKKTTVLFFTSSPKFNNGGKVTAKGTLNSTSACKAGRGVKLQLLDSSGAVTSVLDGSTSDLNGNWKLQAQLPKGIAAGTASVRVKATKAAVGKFVCKAGVSPSVLVPAT